ncbi:hypothetical protein H4S01_002158 [Coemansia sp. RSA 2610]|nr:hypothetical protein H4S01_002158 [Coemansia sp. RSA 2610]
MMAPNPICSHCNSDFVEEIEAENDPREFLAGLQGEHGQDDEMENEFGGAGNYNQELQTMLQDLLTHIVGRPVTADGVPGRPGAMPGTERPRQAQAGEAEEGTEGGLAGVASTTFGEAREGSGQADGSGNNPTDARPNERRMPGMRTWTSSIGNGQVSVSVGSFPGDISMPGGMRHADGTAGGDNAADSEHERRPLFIDPDENAPISLGNLVSSLISVLGGAPRDGAGGQMFGAPIGNLGDYVWGQNSFDDIITHIMEQNQGVHAPPPASEDSILKMPRRTITAEEVARKFECGICMEEYKSDEEVMALPCKHFYHLECIDHWLKMNGTCPICRTRIDEDQPTHSAPPAPRAHSDLPGSFPSSPATASQSNRGPTQGDSAPPPDPEPMD